jgi:CheY-like chemotaxis protein
MNSKNLLVVEDNPTDVILLKESLAQNQVDCQITVLEDGEKAIEYLRDLDSKGLPDLVILDLNLPKYDGMEVLRKYSSDPRMKDIPVAIFTSSKSNAERARAQTFGVREYIHKPMSYDDFMEVGKVFGRLLEESAPPRIQ